MIRSKFARILGVIVSLIAACGPSDERRDRGSAIRFTGVVLDEQNQPVPETAVTLFDTGEFGVTADDGRFDFESVRVGNDLEIYLDGEQLSESVGLGTIPDDTRFVALRLQIDRATFKIAAAIAEFSNVEPLPTPQPTTALPGQTPSPSLFDQNGNTSAFGIPSGITGNIGRGTSVWNGTCQSCHARDKAGRSFQAVRRSLTTIPDMQSIRISPQQTADVVAYLNRSRR